MAASKLRMVKNAPRVFFTRACALASIMVMTGCQNVVPNNPSTNSSDDLQKLTAALDSADSQTEMNLASGKISEFWDARLSFVEKRLTECLAASERNQFANSEKQWRNFRTQEVRFQASRYAGGSIQPLIRNQTYSETTEHRVTELESLLAELSNTRQTAGK